MTHCPRRCNSCLFTGAFCYGRVAEWFKVELLKLGRARSAGSNPALTGLVGNALPKCQGSETLQKLITLKIDVT